MIEEVKARMQEAADAHDFEKAAALRDTWIALREMVKQRVRVTATPEMHAADARAGIRALQQQIGLPAAPTLIEGFDISNLFGTHSVASMVAAVDGLPDRRLYRRFRIRTVQGADDPRSIAEVIESRYENVRDEGKPFPGLILIDGGVTQLRAAREALARLGLSHIPTVGLAKEMEEIVLDDGRPPLLLPLDSDALRVLTRLRDEAHRFAIDYHRRLRNRLIRESALDEIPGIGPARKAALLKHFGSVYRPGPRHCRKRSKRFPASTCHGRRHPQGRSIVIGKPAAPAAPGETDGGPVRDADRNLREVTAKTVSARSCARWRRRLPAGLRNVSLKKTVALRRLPDACGTADFSYII